VATFGADYRWETWRLQTPRNSRMNLMLAKFVVFALAAAIGLLLMPLGGFLGALLRVVIEGSHVDLPSLGPWFLGFLRAFAGSWLETLVVGGVAAFIAVATRSNVAAIIVTLLAAFAQAITLGIVTAIPKPITLDQMATFPSLAGQVVRGQPIGPDQVVVAGAPIAALFLILWLAVLAAATIALFQRQELTRE
jgi:ABC-2 type transport system permease protein